MLSVVFNRLNGLRHGDTKHHYTEPEASNKCIQRNQLVKGAIASPFNVITPAISDLVVIHSPIDIHDQ